MFQIFLNKGQELRYDRRRYLVRSDRAAAGIWRPLPLTLHVVKPFPDLLQPLTQAVPYRVFCHDDCRTQKRSNRNQAQRSKYGRSKDGAASGRSLHVPNANTSYWVSQTHPHSTSAQEARPSGGLRLTPGFGQLRGYLPMQLL
jgi:hypothetical protein